MKKILAILTVLILTAGMMFADPSQANETAAIDIAVAIGEIVPSFQLLYSNTYRTNEEAEEFGTNSSYSLPEISTGKDISKETIQAEFYAVIARGARQTAADYLLTFSAGAFNTTTNKNPNPTECSSSELVSVLDADDAGALTVSVINANQASVFLNGSLAARQIDLLKFVATWNSHSGIDSGTYSADVTMTVSSL